MAEKKQRNGEGAWTLTRLACVGRCIYQHFQCYMLLFIIADALVPMHHPRRDRDPDTTAQWHPTTLAAPNLPKIAQSLMKKTGKICCAKPKHPANTFSAHKNTPPSHLLSLRAEQELGQHLHRRRQLKADRFPEVEAEQPPPLVVPADPNPHRRVRHPAPCCISEDRAPEVAQGGLDPRLVFQEQRLEGVYEGTQLEMLTDTKNGKKGVRILRYGRGRGENRAVRQGVINEKVVPRRTWNNLTGLTFCCVCGTVIPTYPWSDPPYPSYYCAATPPCHRVSRQG